MASEEAIKRSFRTAVFALAHGTQFFVYLDLNKRRAGTTVLTRHQVYITCGILEKTEHLGLRAVLVGSGFFLIIKKLPTSTALKHPSNWTALLWPLQVSGFGWGTISTGGAFTRCCLSQQTHLGPGLILTTSLQVSSHPLGVGPPGWFAADASGTEGPKCNDPSDTKLAGLKHCWEFMQLKDAVPNQHLSNPLRFEPWCWEMLFVIVQITSAGWWTWHSKAELR